MESFSDPWSLRSLESSLEDTYQEIYVLEDVLGIYGYTIASHFALESELLRIVVSKEKRKKGLGRKLLSHFLCRAKYFASEFCYLEVAEDNHDARSLYEAFSFETYRTRKNYYTKEGKDAFCMRKKVE